MRYYPARFLFLMLLFAFGCKDSSVVISGLTPAAVDGVLNLRMNHIAHDDLLNGQWSAPRLGRGKKFYRSPLTSHSGLSFRALKKEVFIVDIFLLNITGQRQLHKK